MRALLPHTRNVSVFSLPSVIGDHDQSVFELQKVDPTFTDSMGHFTRHFETLLTNLNMKNSITEYCIETYLMKSERKFFNMYNDAQLKVQPKERALDEAAWTTPSTTRRILALLGPPESRKPMILVKLMNGSLGWDTRDRLPSRGL